MSVNNTPLMQILGFTDEELTLNRAGQLSERQQAEVAELLRQKRSITLVVVVLFVVILAARTILNIVQGNSLELLPLELGFAFVFILIAVLLNRLVDDDLRHQRISTVGGTAETKIQPFKIPAGRETKLYILKIGSNRFDFSSQAVLEAFEPGQVYRVYYIRRSTLPVILSAERV